MNNVPNLRWSRAVGRCYEMELLMCGEIEVGRVKYPSVAMRAIHFTPSVKLPGVKCHADTHTTVDYAKLDVYTAVMKWFKRIAYLEYSETTNGMGSA